MPILLDDPNLFMQTNRRTGTPKYFDKEVMTGNGKTSGVFNASLRPGRYLTGEGPHTFSIASLNVRSKATNSSVTTHAIPTGVLTAYSLEGNADRGLTLPLPVPEDLFEVSSHATTLPIDVWFGLTPQGLLVTKDGSGDKMHTEVRMAYRMEVYVVPAGQSPQRVRLVSSAPYQLGEGYAMAGYSFGPLDDAEELIRKASAQHTGTGQGAFVDLDGLADWMAEYDTYERTCRLAEHWSSTEVADTIETHITELFTNGTPDDQCLNRLTLQLRYLETYPVALEAYRKIHTTIMAVSPSDVASVLVKQNINLLMNHTLQELEDMKPQLPAPPTPATNTVPSHFSVQQRNAITTEEPLVLCQAGAGTGKSTVILGRIKHLVDDRGVKAADITVLSFTNAAADNIKEKNPAVGSMTIASMIHDIYRLNFPTHELSSVDTIVNSLAIFYPTSQLARTFSRRLVEAEKNKVPGATTALNAFVEHYRDDVLEMLGTIRQTCLELEIILAYQLIDQMKEPPNVSSRYLIVDEVQDNSIFEFIYTLKYVAKHKENLFIVGDASQTLFEFRASNPKALNALEGSGVFTCYKLTTNYRSNQAVLNFANVHLHTIEANQIARIQLKANQLANPTAKEFTEAVTLDYRWYSRVGDFAKDLPAFLQNVIKPWVDDRLAKGQQVAFLAYTRAEVKVMENVLRQMYPGVELNNLVSDKSYSSTVFSEFIKNHWDEVRQVPNLQNASFAITKGIDTHLDKLVRGDATKARPMVIKMTSDWWVQNAATINSWVALTGTKGPNGQPLMSADEFFDNLRRNLLDYEVAHNAIRQALLNQRNKERKEKNMKSKAPLVVSTIHGAKGLEFDHVVGLYKFDSQMDEATKRLYYVMLTRAIRSEYVLAYGTVKKPKLEADYALVVNDLLYREKLATLRAQGRNLDILSEDEVEAALALLEKQREDALAAGDLDAAAAVPGVIEYSTRGAELPEPVDEDEESEETDDGSAFTKATA